MVTWAWLGQVSGFTSPASADTRVGCVSFRARNARLAVWQAMSPIAPVPKSHQPRQANGWYGDFAFRRPTAIGSGYSAYGRNGAGPSHSSQWTCRGTGASGGRFVTSGACGQTGRLVQTWTSFTGPIMPAWTSSTPAPQSGVGRPLVAHLGADALLLAPPRISRRASYTVRVSGFWT